MGNKDLNKIFITSDLLDTLLDLASKSSPKKISIGLTSEKSKKLDLKNISNDKEVFYDFYFPSAKSIKDIFGMDISTPPSSTQARFISHPSGYAKIMKNDELHKIIFIAVPPWDKESVKVYNRNSEEYDLEIIN